MLCAGRNLLRSNARILAFRILFCLRQFHDVRILIIQLPILLLWILGRLFLLCRLLWGFTGSSFLMPHGLIQECHDNDYNDEDQSQVDQLLVDAQRLVPLSIRHADFAEILILLQDGLVFCRIRRRIVVDIHSSLLVIFLAPDKILYILPEFQSHHPPYLCLMVRVSFPSLICAMSKTFSTI